MAKPVVMWARPSGVEFIAVWSGELATIPDAWTLVDSLADHFVKGGGDPGHPAGETGGVASYDLTHLHDWGLVFFPSPYPSSDEEHLHAHSGLIGIASTDAHNGLDGIAGGDRIAEAVGHAHAVTVSTTATYPHNHPVIGQSDSFAYTQNNLPPYRCQPYMRGTAEIPVGAVAWSDQPPSAFTRFTAGPATTLSADVAAADPLSFDTWTFASDLGLTPPFSVYVGTEEAAVLFADGPSWTVVRGVNGTTTDAHAAGTAVGSPKYKLFTGGFVIGADGETFPLGEFFGSDDLITILHGFHAHGLTSLLVGSTGHDHVMSPLSQAPDAGTQFIGPAGNGAAILTHIHNLVEGRLPPGGTHAHTLFTTREPNVTWTPGSLSPLPPYRVFTVVQRVDYGQPSSDTCPVGTILATPNETAPDGWQICDGTDETLNLQGKCVLGAGGDTAVGAEGGTAGFDLPSHAHGPGSTHLDIGSGSHDYSGMLLGASVGFGVATAGVGTSVMMDEAVHEHPFVLDSLGGIISTGGDHDHPVGGAFGASDPPFASTGRLAGTLVLNWIQKVSG